MARKPRKKAQPDEGHDDVDHKIRVNELKEGIREATGQEPTFATSADCPPEVEEQFLKQVLDVERGGWVTNYDQLVKAGFDFPESKQLDDKQLAAKLNDLFARLAHMHVFLSHTNHLSDRELYDWLREDGLREEVMDMSGMPGGAWHLDVLGSYGEEEVNQYNRYYATEKERKKHKRDYPAWPLPPHVNPPFDRDRTLPQWEP